MRCAELKTAARKLVAQQTSLLKDCGSLEPRIRSTLDQATSYLFVHVRDSCSEDSNDASKASAAQQRYQVSPGLSKGELVVAAVMGLVFIFPWWKICSKAGFPGALSLTLLIPVINLVVLYYLAFAEWPVHRELDRLRTGRDGVE
jgi:hypothetical protein